MSGQFKLVGSLAMEGVYGARIGAKYFDKCESRACTYLAPVRRAETNYSKSNDANMSRLRRKMTEIANLQDVDDVI